MSKEIKLPCYGITLSMKKDQEGLDCKITSELQDESNGDLTNVAFCAIEATILAHAAAGINIESPGYIEGIEVAVMYVMKNIHQ